MYECARLISDDVALEIVAAQSLRTKDERNTFLLSKNLLPRGSFRIKIMSFAIMLAKPFTNSRL